MPKHLVIANNIRPHFFPFLIYICIYIYPVNMPVQFQYWNSTGCLNHCTVTVLACQYTVPKRYRFGVACTLALYRNGTVSGMHGYKNGTVSVPVVPVCGINGIHTVPFLYCCYSLRYQRYHFCIDVTGIRYQWYTDGTVTVLVVPWYVMNGTNAVPFL